MQLRRDKACCQSGGNAYFPAAENSPRIYEKCGVQHESWDPFAGGRKDFFTNPVLCEIGENDMNAIRALDEKENGVTHLKRVHHLPITLNALFARGLHSQFFTSVKIIWN